MPNSPAVHAWILLLTLVPATGARAGRELETRATGVDAPPAPQAQEDVPGLAAGFRGTWVERVPGPLARSTARADRLLGSWDRTRSADGRPGHVTFDGRVLSDLPEGSEVLLLEGGEVLFLVPTPEGPELRLRTEGVPGGVFVASAVELGLGPGHPGAVLDQAPRGWPDPWGGAPLVALPDAGRVVRLDLTRRGAGFALLGVADLLQPRGAARAEGILLDPGGAGLDLLVTVEGAPHAPRVLQVERADGAGTLHPGTPTPDPDADCEPWVRQLERPERQVRDRARQVLLGRGEQALAALAQALQGEVLLPDENLPRALRRARYRSDLDGPVARLDAMALVLQLGLARPELRERAGILLERCLDHELPDTRAAGARALGRWPVELADPDRLVDLLRDPAPEVRAAVCEALQLRGERLAGRELVAAWETEGDRFVRAALGAAIGHLGAWEALVAALAGEVDPTRRAVHWELLDREPDRERVLCVRELLTPGPDYFVRLEALEHLSGWCRRSGPDGAPVWKDGAELVRRSLERSAANDPAPAVRERAVELLEGLPEHGDR